MSVLTRAFHRIRSRATRDTRPGGLVLAYHRVAAVDSDPQCLAVSPERFADHVRVIAGEGVPMSLEEMTDAASRGTLPARATCVTFDDGYADVLEAAVPLLSREGVPATVFVATKTLDEPREFWWDELERWCLAPGDLPSQLRLEINSETQVWELNDDACWRSEDADRFASWNVTQSTAPTNRHRVYLDLCRMLTRLDDHARSGVLDRLAALAQGPRHPRSSQRPLTIPELTSLARTAGVSIGSHTRSHPSLGALSQADQHGEIAAGRERLEGLLGSPVTAFAYPFGGTADVTAATVAAARDAGIAIACTTQPGRVHAGTDRHAVPRVVVRNWPAAEFRERWSRWLAA